MSTSLKVVMGHCLTATEIARLPSLLNEFFAPYHHHIQLRENHGYTGSIIEAENGGWIWKSSNCDDWEPEQGKLDKEDLWDWDWHPKQGQSFEEWMQAEKLSGSISLRGYYGMTLHIGSRSLVFCTGIRWRHFVFDRIIQDDLRQFLGFVSQFLETSTVIYMPDDIPPACDVPYDYVDKGLGLEEIRFWLASQEPPAQSLIEMTTTAYVKSTDRWAARGYYIEQRNNSDSADS